jgi:hypothetical protein
MELSNSAVRPAEIAKREAADGVREGLERLNAAWRAIREDIGTEALAWFNARVSDALEALSKAERSGAEIANASACQRLLVSTFSAGPEALLLRPQKVAWLGEEKRLALRTEALRPEAQRIQRSGMHYVKCGLEALKVSVDPRFVRWAAAGLGAPLDEAMKLTYIVYEGEGASLRDHLDDPRHYAYNVLACLEAHAPDGRAPQSVLRLRFSSGECENIALQPGEAVLIDGAAVVHARTALGAGERILLLSLGFNAAT